MWRKQKSLQLENIRLVHEKSNSSFIVAAIVWHFAVFSKCVYSYE